MERVVASSKPPMILKLLQQPGESNVQPAVPSTSTPEEVPVLQQIQPYAQRVDNAEVKKV